MAKDSGPPAVQLNPLPTHFNEAVIVVGLGQATNVARVLFNQQPDAHLAAQSDISNGPKESRFVTFPAVPAHLGVDTRA